MRDQTRREVNQWEDDMTSNKIKITRCESGDWEILEYDGYRDSNHHIDYIDFLKHLGYEVEEVEVTDEEMEKNVLDILYIEIDLIINTIYSI